MLILFQLDKMRMSFFGFGIVFVFFLLLLFLLSSFTLALQISVSFCNLWRFPHCPSSSSSFSSSCSSQFLIPYPLSYFTALEINAQIKA